jgi:hypothetical protein
MAFDFGQVSMFKDPNSHADPIIEALAKAITMPAFKGVVYQMMSPPLAAIAQKEYEVYSRTKSTRNGATDAAWDASSTPGLAIMPQCVNGLTVGHQLKVQDEIVVIAKVNASAGTIDVQARGMSGTTAAAHSGHTSFKVIGFAGRDTDLKNAKGVTESTMIRNNYVQTVFELLDWEKSAELKRKGLSPEDIISLLRQEAGIRVAETLSYMAIHGVKHRGTETQSFATSGLLASLVDRGKNGDCPIKTFHANNSPINETMLHSALDAVFDYGSPDAIILSSANARRFKSFAGAGDAGIGTTINTNRTDTGAGRHITHHDDNGVSMRLVIDADIPDSVMPIVTTADLKKGWLVDDALTTKIEPPQSTREYRESIQGTIGFLVENVGYSHILIQNLALA